MSGEVILLVDDNAALRALGRHVLQAGGYAVLEAPDGAQALEVAGRHPGPIHLLVADVSLPGGTGRQLAERLDQVRPGIRVLYLSGDPDAPAQGRIPQGAAFLAKPFALDELGRKVREVLASRA